ncbi:MAG: NosD protein [Ignavibacteriales bacterium]|jgi:nitrous oxidase accessory protein
MRPFFFTNFSIALILFCLLTLQAVPATHTHDRNTNADLFASIQRAGRGDTVYIHEGIYRISNLKIDKELSLIGKGKVILQADGPGDILSIQHDRVLIKNLTFRETETSFMKDFAAVKVEMSNYITIANCVFENNFFGIYLSNSTGSVITDNKLTGSGKKESSSGNGIHLWNCRQITVEGNTVSNHRDGIYLEFTKETGIKRNKSFGNLRYGLHFMFSDTCRYTANTFNRNGAGVAVMYSTEIEMTKNSFSDNNGTSSYGLLLKDIRKSTITGNQFIRNTIAVYIEASSRISFTENILQSNGTALKVMANSETNRFISNSFLNNSFDVASNSRQNYNEYRLNYWDTYSGYDMNKDGIGDVPHSPVRLSSVITAKYPSSIILMRSFFMGLLDMTEKIFPAFTPSDLTDTEPLMRRKL